jgi:hypothetical protein
VRADGRRPPRAPEGARRQFHAAEITHGKPRRELGAAAAVVYTGVRIGDRRSAIAFRTSERRVWRRREKRGKRHIIQAPEDVHGIGPRRA